jgi:hypothetical protein
MKILITPKGECNGVYVTNESANGFDVIELQHGTSNAAFSWFISATRANEVHAGVISNFEDHRFKPITNPAFDFNQVLPGKHDENKKAPAE